MRRTEREVGADLREPASSASCRSRLQCQKNGRACAPSVWGSLIYDIAFLRLRATPTVMPILSAAAPNFCNLLPPRWIPFEPARPAVELCGEARQAAGADCAPTGCKSWIEVRQLRVDPSEVLLLERSFRGERWCGACWSCCGQYRRGAGQGWWCRRRSWRALAGQWRLLWPRGEALRGTCGSGTPRDRCVSTHSCAFSYSCRRLRSADELSCRESGALPFQSAC